MTDWSTTELWDTHPEVQVLGYDLRDYGGLARFAGPVLVVRSHDRHGSDRSLVDELCCTPGAGRVLVVDAAAHRGSAVLDETSAAAAVHHRWAGVVVYGVVADVERLRTLDLGIRALGSSPRRASARGAGECNSTAEYASVTVATGHHLYADETGIVVAERSLTTSLDAS